MVHIYVVAASLAAVACAWDVRTARIPNWLTFGAAAAGMVFHLATGGSGSAGHAVAGWGLGLLLFLGTFLLGGMGAGDVKLVAALGAWLGPTQVFWLSVYTYIAGGVLALVVSLATGYLGQASRNLWLLLTHWRVCGVRPLPELTLERAGSPRLAFGVPILAGTVVAIWLR